MRMNRIKGNYKGLFVLAGIIAIGLAGAFYNKYLNEQPKKYTVGEILYMYKPAKGNTRVKFEYYVNHKRYEGSVSNNDYEKMAKPSMRFLVEYPEGYEHEGVMLLNTLIPPNIKPPPNGWDSRPKLQKQKTRTSGERQ